jgi:hypothetical protein
VNERIRELAEQTDAYAWEQIDEGANFNEQPRYFAEKFAELIVKECIQVAVNKDSGYMHTANVAGYMAAGRSTAAQMIREHFGVES